MPDPLDPVEALRLSSALLALLPECKGATHSEAVSHCAECCFGSGYELHGPEDQVILDAATFLAALRASAAPAPEGVPEDPARSDCANDYAANRRLVPLSDTPHEKEHPMSPDPISDEALASVRRVVESPVLRSDPGGVPIVALREVDAAALLARLDAAEAALVPEGVVTLDGQRFTVVRPSRHSTRCYLVPYRPEDTKGAGYE